MPVVHPPHIPDTPHGREHGRPIVIVNRIDDLVGPQSGSVHLPIHLDWSSRRTYDLENPRRLRSLYEVVLKEATAESDLTSHLNAPALVELWSDLTLPAHLRTAWEECHPQLQTFERREDRVALELHRAVAKKLIEDPAAVLSVVPENLAVLRQHVRGSLAHGWLDTWAELASGPVDELIETMLATDELGMELRQNSPFLGVLSHQERLDAIDRAAQKRIKSHPQRIFRFTLSNPPCHTGGVGVS